MKQALLIGPMAGEWDVDFLRSLVAREGYVHIVAVDGGADACVKAEIIPTLFVGDGDSASSSALAYVDMMQVERINLEVNKDESDFLSALIWLRAQGVGSFEAVGFSGGRFDHQLALMGDMATVGLDAQFFAERFCMWVATQRGRLPRKVVISKADFSNFSVFALAEPATVSITGAHWPLDKRELEPLVSLGLSNEFAQDAFDARVLVHAGTVAVIANYER